VGIEPTVVCRLPPLKVRDLLDKIFRFDSANLRVFQSFSSGLRHRRKRSFAAAAGSNWKA
jgi:hypothetical protein